jgi:predicted acyl esterase
LPGQACAALPGLFIDDGEYMNGNSSPAPQRGRTTVLLAAPPALALAGTEQAAREPGAGTAGRAWLAPGTSPADVAAAAQGDAAQVVELKETPARLEHDARTGVWGIPVPRRGDPDYAPGHPRYTGDVPDGPLVLPARVFVPGGALDPALPCILMTNGYGSTDRAPEGRAIDGFVAHGYTGVVVSLRQASGDPIAQQVGVNDYYRYYGEDGVAIINDIVRRYGCGAVDGDPSSAKVGMIGGSLVGGSQWAVLGQPDYPAALKAIAPDVAGISYADLWHPGGMLPGPMRAQRPGREFVSIFPAHREFDAFWVSRQLSQGQLMAAATRRIAVLITDGWDDYNLSGAVPTYQDYLALSGPTNKKLVIGPSGHPTPTDTYRPLALQWMDHWLKGKANGAEDQRVLIYVRGPDRWRAERAWPLPDTRRTVLYLGAAHNATIKSRNGGSLVVKAGKRQSLARFDYDPLTGPFLNTMLSSYAKTPEARRYSADNTSNESRVLTWTSPALAEPTEVTGIPELVFWAKADGPDADFVVQLSDVAPDGKSTAITQGHLNGPRAAYVQRDAAIAPPHPLVPGEPRQFHLKMVATSYVFQGGHRIRVAMGGGADMAVDQHGKPILGQGPGKNPHAFSVQVLQDGKQASQLILPVIGTRIEEEFRSE